NKLASIEGEKNFTLNYDNNGNTISELDGGVPALLRTYVYNQNQRLARVTDTDTILGEYVYNGDGHRVKKYTNNGAWCKIYQYDKNGLLIAESSSSGTIKAEYIYINGRPLAKIEGDNIYYYHNDHLGTPMLMTDSTGQVVWQGEFLPFGEAMSVSGSVTNNLRFPGQYYDEETGMHQNWFRDYRAEMGRYVEADPIGIEGGDNHLFIYVRNNPVNWTDSLGLFGPGRPMTLYPGHADFPGGDYFDYNLEDNDATTNPVTGDPKRHFRDLPVSEYDVAKAISSCNKNAFQRAMHRGQDYFSHYSKGYRWKPFSRNRGLGLGHMFPLIDPTAPDRDREAWNNASKWSQDQLNKWHNKCGCNR
ncbi:MAG: RHS repeat-associated core domain-containing protein, partial [Nitrospirota bacterium]